MQATIEKTKRRSSSGSDEGVERVAQVALAARGLLYLTMGWLAWQLASGQVAQADARGAIGALAAKPFGQVAVGFLAVGFAAYAFWRGWQAFTHEDDEDDALPGWLRRLTYVVRALIYVALAFLAARQVFSGGGSMSASSTSGQLLDTAWGTVLVLVLAAIVAGVAIYQLYSAATTRFADDFDDRDVDDDTRRWLVPLGVVGFGARGVAFGTVAWFLAKAALTPESAGSASLDAALKQLIVSTSYGAKLVTLVAVGFVAFALFELAMIRYAELRDLG